MEYCGARKGGRGGEHMTGAEICVSPVFSSLAKRKYPPYHLTQLLTQLGLRQESDNLKGGILWRSQRGYTIYISLNQCRGICIPSQFFDFSSCPLLDEILSVIPSI